MRVGLASRIAAVRLAPAAIHRQYAVNQLSSRVRPSLPYGSRLRTRAAAESSSETYPGMYGSWQITQQDLVEVISNSKIT
jgi:hypothetical protein